MNKIGMTKEEETLACQELYSELLRMEKSGDLKKYFKMLK